MIKRKTKRKFSWICLWSCSKCVSAPLLQVPSEKRTCHKMNQPGPNSDQPASWLKSNESRNFSSFISLLFVQDLLPPLNCWPRSKWNAAAGAAAKPATVRKTSFQDLRSVWTENEAHEHKYLTGLLVTHLEMPRASDTFHFENTWTWRDTVVLRKCCLLWTIFRHGALKKVTSFKKWEEYRSFCSRAYFRANKRMTKLTSIWLPKINLKRQHVKQRRRVVCKPWMSWSTNEARLWKTPKCHSNCRLSLSSAKLASSSSHNKCLLTNCKPAEWVLRAP